jgi:hypothetical protein
LTAIIPVRPGLPSKFTVPKWHTPVGNWVLLTRAKRSVMTAGSHRRARAGLRISHAWSGDNAARFSSDEGRARSPGMSWFLKAADVRSTAESEPALFAARRLRQTSLTLGDDSSLGTVGTVVVACGSRRHGFHCDDNCGSFTMKCKPQSRAAGAPLTQCNERFPPPAYLWRNQ